eukprot:scaffold195820_cov30-Tisochrysis_lutea.AAC.1
MAYRRSNTGVPDDSNGTLQELIMGAKLPPVPHLLSAPAQVSHHLVGGPAQWPDDRRSERRARECFHLPAEHDVGECLPARLLRLKHFLGALSKGRLAAHQVARVVVEPRAEGALPLFARRQQVDGLLPPLLALLLAEHALLVEQLLIRLFRQQSGRPAHAEECRLLAHPLLQVKGADLQGEQCRYTRAAGTCDGRRGAPQRACAAPSRAVAPRSSPAPPSAPRPRSRSRHANPLPNCHPHRRSGPPGAVRRRRAEGSRPKRRREVAPMSLAARDGCPRPRSRAAVR